MASVEAAASLFGSEEASSDPFAALGTDTVSQGSVDDPFFGDRTSTNTDSHFPLDGAGIHRQSDSAARYSAPEGLSPTVSQQSAWYGTQAQSQNEGRPSTVKEAVLTIAEQNAYTVQQNYPDTSHRKVYDSYPPATVVNAHLSFVNTPSYHPTQYDAYETAPPSNGDFPLSQPVAPTTSSYTPYAYAPPAQHSTTSYFHTNAGYGTQNATSTPSIRPSPATMTVPPPPSTVPTVNRPKLPNAYDPPFPTSTKSAKRGVRNASGSHSYGYGPHEPSPPASGLFPVGQPSQTPSHPSRATPLAPPTNPPPPPPPRSAMRSMQVPISNDGQVNGNERTSEGNTVKPSDIDSTPSSYSVNSIRDHGLYGGSSWNSKGAELAAFQDGGLSQSMPSSQGHDQGYPMEPNTYTEPAQSQSPSHRRQTGSPLSSRMPQSRGPSPAYTHHSVLASFRTTAPAQDASTLSRAPQRHCSPSWEAHENSNNRSQSLKLATETELEHHEMDVYSSAENHATGGTTSISQTGILDQRTSSPVLACLIGKPSSPDATVTPYISMDEEPAAPANTWHGRQHMANPYEPKAYANGFQEERTASADSVVEQYEAKPPLPVISHPPLKLDRNRSISNGSIWSSTGQDGPLGSFHPTKRTRHESDYTPSYSMANGLEFSHHPPNEHSQDVLLKPFHASYAPSPSLLGANDPLGRTAVRVPIFSFGFGGKVATCFHGADLLSTGFDVALSSRNSTGIRVRMLKHVIPQSALDCSAASFSGPLFADPGTTSLVRTGPTSQTKIKKAQVMNYLCERTEELGLGLRYLAPESLESRRAEGKIILLKILRLMVEYDGRLTGSTEVEAAVRIALVPRLEGTSTHEENTTSGFAAPLNSALYLPSTQSDEGIISTISLRTAHLDKIQDLLLRGERKQAYHYALDEKLWAHAMVISSSIDKEAWKEVVNEFLKNELGVQDNTYSRSNQSTPFMNRREGLRVAYSLFSGQGAAAVQELVPQNLLLRATRVQPPQVPPHLTPNTPNFATTAHGPLYVPVEAIKQWPETVAMMLSCHLSQETSAALTSVGDQLVANQLIEAGHVCYLLAPQTSPIGGVGHPTARMVLVGSRSPQSWPSFCKDPDPLVFSEILEFALSLTPPSRGQEPFSGMTHLQAYRFIRAMSLAEIGDIRQANRYCDAITATINRSSPYSTPALVEQLQGLSDRIAGVTQADKSFWTGTKIGKPSLDTIGGWLEGRFTKLVTGDSETEKSEEIAIQPDSKDFSGPFSHYSTISSTTPSARSSPQPSVTNYNVLPPVRTGSAMAYSSAYPVPQIDRASSAIDYTRRKSSPTPRIVSANAPTANFFDSLSITETSNSQKSQDHHKQDSDDPITARPSIVRGAGGEIGQEATWWSSSTYGEGNAAQTPIAATFLRVDENTVAESSNGFISLMDNTSSVAPQASSGNSFGVSHPDDEEDLGFGNSKPKPKTSEETGGKTPSTVEPPKAVTPAQPETKPAPATKGWLSRWWKSDGPGPIKANLGNDSDFHFDKDLGRWVNRKAGPEPPKPAAPPPPPSRAQTASPGMTGSRPPCSESTTPPPARSASAIDLSTSPPSRTIMRVRSNLVPTPESAPSTPTGTRLAAPAPPPGRPRSQASKRNVRNRYVNVFQEGSGA